MGVAFSMGPPKRKRELFAVAKIGGKGLILAQGEGVGRREKVRQGKRFRPSQRRKATGGRRGTQRPSRRGDNNEPLMSKHGMGKENRVR